MKLSSWLVFPIAHLLQSRMSKLLKDVKKGLSDKIAAVVMLLFAVLMLYICVLGCGIIIALVLLPIIRLFYAVLITMIFYLIVTLVSFLIGKALFNKSLKDDNKKIDMIRD